MFRNIALHCICTLSIPLIDIPFRAQMRLFRPRTISRNSFLLHHPIAVLLNRPIVDNPPATSSPQLPAVSLSSFESLMLTPRIGLERKMSCARCLSFEFVGPGTEYTEVVLSGEGGEYLSVTSWVERRVDGGLEGRMVGEMESRARLLDVTTSGKRASAVDEDCTVEWRSGWTGVVTCETEGGREPTKGRAWVRERLVYP